jgi:hypothetical protein
VLTKVLKQCLYVALKRDIWHLPVVCYSNLASSPCCVFSILLEKHSF